MNSLLYLSTVLIWGSTWLAIKLQLGSVAPTWSVVYRFSLAALVLIAFCVITGKRMRFSHREHQAMALQGLLMFSLNYILYYIGTQYFVSGLVAVVFASIIIMNIINSRIFFGSPLIPQVILGAIVGLLGLGVVFSSQLQELYQNTANTQHLGLGLGICLLATLVASFGNMIAAYNQRLNLPILQSNAIGMAYGSLFVVIIALLLGQKPTFDLSWRYTGSLLYLSIIGSVLAFGIYLKLLSRIGPARAAYAFVLLPIIALGLSTRYEGFNWTWLTLVGVALVLLGNVLVLLSKKRYR